tara:strand:+ start:235 stop:603 length:369 start_codon:yes stop_codon:yes gene_type:complete
VIRNEDQKFDDITINNIDDVYYYIDLLKIESQSNSTSSTNSTLKDVYYQLPFFSCPNNFIDPRSQEDISKYLYCEDTKTPPYNGSYGKTPLIWKEKHFLIKQALSILYQSKRDEMKQKHGHK